MRDAYQGQPSSGCVFKYINLNIAFMRMAAFSMNVLYGSSIKASGPGQRSFLLTR
jgi:hypothetical protein